MPKLIVTINEECYRCKAKLQKELTCLQGEFSIKKIEYDNCNKVTITGKFDADELSSRLHCKASKCIKNIEKVDDKKDDEKDDKKEPPCKLVHVYPWSYDSYPQCPYPSQPPYGSYPSWQGSSTSCYPQQCKCHYCCKPPSPARPSSPCACAKCSRDSSCSSTDHHCGGAECYSGSSCSSKPVTTYTPAGVPCTLPASLIVCNDDNPSYACSVM